MRLILYSKAGCHLCEGLEQKLRSITTPQFELEIREISTNPEWWSAYEYEIPVLYLDNGAASQLLPRMSPRASIQQVQEMLQSYWDKNTAQ
jgi:Glutaredoxin-like domain (DUF836)